MENCTVQIPPAPRSMEVRLGAKSLTPDNVKSKAGRQAFAAQLNIYNEL
jgi:hypothetical protein